MFIMRLDLKTYLIFKLSRDDERKVHHHHFHHRTFSSPNNSCYKQRRIFPFEKRRKSGDAAKREYHIAQEYSPFKINNRKFSKLKQQTRVLPHFKPP